METGGFAEDLAPGALKVQGALSGQKVFLHKRSSRWQAQAKERGGQRAHDKCV